MEIEQCGLCAKEEKSKEKNVKWMPKARILPTAFAFISRKWNSL